MLDDDKCQIYLLWVLPAFISSISWVLPAFISFLPMRTEIPFLNWVKP